VSKQDDDFLVGYMMGFFSGGLVVLFVLGYFWVT
jgi:hypothetical protein